jgi:hypothetical protein
MWSLTSPRAKRISGSKNFRPSAKKDFFNTIERRADITGAISSRLSRFFKKLRFIDFLKRDISHLRFKSALVSRIEISYKSILIKLGIEMWTYSVDLSDPTNAGGSNDSILVYDLQQALGVWSQYIVGLGTFVVALDIANTSVGRASGGPTSSYFVGTNSAGLNVFEPSSQYELTTGQHVAGTTSDVTITVDPGYFQYLDLASGLTYGSQVPNNELSPIIVFLHELLHGFGMSGWYNQNGALPGNYESTFDALITKTSSGAYFTGANAEAAYGGPVPLTTDSTTENYYHFGNEQSDRQRTPSTVQDPLTLDLMNGIVFFDNYQYTISNLDLGVLKDLGYNVRTPPTLTVQNDPTATHGQTLALSSLVTISDPDSFGYQKLELWDSNGTAAGGQFVVNSVAQSGGHEIDVMPANVANTVFDVGSLGGTDTLWAQLLENDGTLTGWQKFTVTAPVARTPTIAVTSDPSATRGQTLALSSLVTIADPDSLGYQKLELWDSNGTVGGGQFVVNSAAQTGGHEIDVMRANVAGTVFDVGSLGGTDTLWAQLLENDGTLTGWQKFTVTAPVARTPTIAVSSDPTATGGQALALSSLVTIADPDSVGYQKLELWDSNGTVAGGQFVVNSAAQSGGHEIDVTPANVAGVVFDAGTSVGTDTLWARLLQNDGTLTAWQLFTVTVPSPTLTVHSDPTATRGQAVSLSSLLTIADPGNVGYQKLELWDSSGTVAGGQFMVNGVAQSGGVEIDVSPANVANSVFDVGTLGGSDTLWARLLQNDNTLTTWQPFTVTAPKATPPTLVVTSDPTATRGQTLSLSSLVTIADPGNVGYQKLELWDSDGTVGGGQFVVNSVAQSGGVEIDVSLANVANTAFDVGTLGGTDTLWARLLQNDNTLTAWQQFTVTAPKATPPTLAVTSDPTATRGQTLSLSSLVTISDPGNVGYQRLELWDSSGTAAGGQFVVNSAAQTGGHEIDVTPANVAGAVFDVGTSAGTDTLWARLLQNDNTLTAWQQFTVTVPSPTLTVNNYTTATPGQVINLSSLVTIADPGNVSYQNLELWDSIGTPAGGEFVVNGVAQTGGHQIDVTPANVAGTTFHEGTSGNTDTLWARLQQNDGTLTAWQPFTVVDPVTVAEGATVELAAAYAGHVTFAGTTGTLQLDNSAGFTGTVAGMTGQDTLDLRDINFASIQQPVFSGTSSGGTLSVTDGNITAKIALLSNYMASTFVASSDGHGGTFVTDPPLIQQPILAQPQHGISA